MHQKLTMLIVDDLQVNLTILELAFEPKYHVLTATSGKEGLELLHRQHVDLLITDIFMEDMDGYQLIRTVRADPDPRLAQMPIIAVTAFNEVSSKKVLEAGANDFVCKPYVKEILTQRVRGLLHELDGEIDLSLYHDAYDYCPMAFLLHRLDNPASDSCTCQTLYLNDAAKALFRLPENVTSDMLPSRDLQLAALRQVVQTNTAIHRTQYYSPMDAHMDVNAYPVGQNMVAVLISDISHFFREERKLRLLGNPNLLSTCTVNLTGGYLEDILVGSGSIFKPEYIRLTDCRQRMELFLSHVQITDADNKRLSPAVLLEEYRKGNNTCSCNFLAQEKQSGQFLWVHVDCEVYTRGETGEIIAVYYYRNATDRFVEQGTTEHIMPNDYDFCGVIQQETKQANLLYFQQNMPEKYVSIPDLDTWSADCIRTYAPAQDSPETILASVKANSLDTIIRELNAHGSYTCEFNIQMPGQPVRRKQAKYLYMDKAAGLIVGSRRDITDIVQAEAANQRKLEQALAEANEANHAKTEFLSRMSHDMRTPMNGIIGMTALTQDLPNLPEEARQNLANINEASHYLLSLINDTLDMSKIESKKITLSPAPVLASSLIDHIVINIRQMAQEKGVELVVNRVNTQLNYINTDAARVQQVFTNLLSNAVKFTPEGGKVVWTIETLRRENGVAHCRLTVEDTGVGMSEEFLPRAFEPFNQENNSESSKYNGTGLGLAIVKSLVEMMGGTISIESRVGQGTRITVYMSFEKLDDYLPESVERSANPSLRGKHVLLCEDHPLNATIVKKVLDKVGVSVDRAVNGKVGLELFSASGEGYFDLILMDIRMPVMDGMQAAKAIRALERSDAKTVPIIALTANTFEDDVKTCLAAGMNAHLGKPFEAQALYELLAQWSGEKK